MKVSRVITGILLAALLAIGAGGIGAAIGFRFGLNEGVRRSPEVAEQLRARRQPAPIAPAPASPAVPGQPPQVQPLPQFQPRGPFMQRFGPRQMMMGNRMGFANRPGMGIFGGLLRLLIGGLLLAALVALAARLMGLGPRRFGPPFGGPRRGEAMWHASAPPPWWDEWHRRAHGESPPAPSAPPPADAQPPADMPPTVRAD